uniref:Uncharacterized protein n=1 Tax=Medicago truncatula TaxID=3880 RepID=A2Q1W5_MEDTR|nr:hypothetical protein MtrDRAFT_AC149129g26v2 [Medicago truncatula]
MAQKTSTTLCTRMNGTPTRIMIATAQTNTIKPKSPSKESHMETLWTITCGGLIHKSRKRQQKIMLKTTTNETCCAISLRFC